MGKRNLNKFIPRRKRSGGMLRTPNHPDSKLSEDRLKVIEELFNNITRIRDSNERVKSLTFRRIDFESIKQNLSELSKGDLYAFNQACNKWETLSSLILQIDELDKAIKMKRDDAQASGKNNLIRDAEKKLMQIIQLFNENYSLSSITERAHIFANKENKDSPFNYAMRQLNAIPTTEKTHDLRDDEKPRETETTPSITLETTSPSLHESDSTPNNDLDTETSSPELIDQMSSEPEPNIEPLSNMDLEIPIDSARQERIAQHANNVHNLLDQLQQRMTALTSRPELPQSQEVRELHARVMMDTRQTMLELQTKTLQLTQALQTQLSTQQTQPSQIDRLQFELMETASQIQKCHERLYNLSLVHRMEEGVEKGRALLEESKKNEVDHSTFEQSLHGLEQSLDTIKQNLQRELSTRETLQKEKIKTSTSLEDESTMELFSRLKNDYENNRTQDLVRIAETLSMRNDMPFEQRELLSNFTSDSLNENFIITDHIGEGDLHDAIHYAPSNTSSHELMTAIEGELGQENPNGEKLRNMVDDLLNPNREDFTYPGLREQMTVLSSLYRHDDEKPSEQFVNKMRDVFNPNIDLTITQESPEESLPSPVIEESNQDETVVTPPEHPNDDKTDDDEEIISLESLSSQDTPDDEEVNKDVNVRHDEPLPSEELEITPLNSSQQTRLLLNFRALTKAFNAISFESDSSKLETRLQALADALKPVLQKHPAGLRDNHPLRQPLETLVNHLPPNENNYKSPEFKALFSSCKGAYKAAKKQALELLDQSSYLSDFILKAKFYEAEIYKSAGSIATNQKTSINQLTQQCLKMLDVLDLAEAKLREKYKDNLEVIAKKLGQMIECRNHLISAIKHRPELGKVNVFSDTFTILTKPTEADIQAKINHYFQGTLVNRSGESTSSLSTGVNSNVNPDKSLKQSDRFTEDARVNYTELKDNNGDQVHFVSVQRAVGSRYRSELHYDPKSIPTLPFDQLVKIAAIEVENFRAAITNPTLPLVMNSLHPDLAKAIFTYCKIRYPQLEVKPPQTISSDYKNNFTKTLNDKAAEIFPAETVGLGAAPKKVEGASKVEKKIERHDRSHEWERFSLHSSKPMEHDTTTTQIPESRKPKNESSTETSTNDDQTQKVTDNSRSSRRF